MRLLKNGKSNEARYVARDGDLRQTSQRRLRWIAAADRRVGRDAAKRGAGDPTRTMTVQGMWRGLIATWIFIPMMWAYWYASAWRECSGASVPPGFDAAMYSAIYSPVITFFITLPLIALAFAIGYFPRWKLHPWQVMIVGIVLVVFSATVGFDSAKPSEMCGPV